jgi:DNA-binding MarR family transcriptional regulator
LPQTRNNDASSSDDRHTPRAKSAFEQLRALLSRRSQRQPIEITEDHIHSILIARRGRESVLGHHLFSDPAWDALLELYAAKLGHRQISLNDLATAIDSPESTTARWIAVLAERGLIASENDTTESSKLWISLTTEGESKMARLMTHWGAAFLSI